MPGALTLAALAVATLAALHASLGAPVATRPAVAASATAPVAARLPEEEQDEEDQDAAPPEPQLEQIPVVPASELQLLDV